MREYTQEERDRIGHAAGTFDGRVSHGSLNAIIAAVYAIDNDRHPLLAIPSDLPPAKDVAEVKRRSGRKNMRVPTTLENALEAKHSNLADCHDTAFTGDGQVLDRLAALEAGLDTASLGDRSRIYTLEQRIARLEASDNAAGKIELDLLFDHASLERRIAALEANGAVNKARRIDKEQPESSHQRNRSS